MDPAGWMLSVRRWRGPLGLELAILFQAHLSTSDPAVMFCLCFPTPSFFPTLPWCPTPHHAMHFILFLLLSPHPRPQLYTRDYFSHFISHSVSRSARWAWEKNTSNLNHRSPKVVLYKTSRQTSRGVELHPKPFMIEQRAKWLTTAQNYCHITCSCSSCRASPNQAGVDFFQDLTTKIIFIPLEPNTSP